MASRVRKVTFSLPVELLEKFREYAAGNYISSVNAGVKAAMEEYSRILEKEKLRRDMLEAANDPLFVKDLNDTMKAFRIADQETVGEIPKW